MFATPVASRTLKGSSKGTERAFRHSPYRNVRGEAGIAEGKKPLPSVIFILEFPSAEQAKAWYNDPAYAQLIDLRQTGADAEIIVLAESHRTL